MRAILSITCSAVPLTADVAISQEPEQAPVTLQNERAQPTAQNQGGLEAVLHRDARFGGPFQSITGPRTDLNLGWEVRSIAFAAESGRSARVGIIQVAARPSTATSRRSASNFAMWYPYARPGGWGTGVGQSLRGAAS